MAMKSLSIARMSLTLLFIGISAIVLSSCASLVDSIYESHVDRRDDIPPEAREELTSALERRSALLEIAETPNKVFTEHGTVDATDAARIELPGVTELPQRDASSASATAGSRTAALDTDPATRSLLRIEPGQSFEHVTLSRAVHEVGASVDRWLGIFDPFGMPTMYVDETGALRHRYRID